jgi:hypothetical protein
VNALQTAASALLEAAGRRERLEAWQAAANLLPQLANLSNTVNPGFAFQLVWSAASNRWFDIAELLAAAVARRADAAPASRRLHAQMLMERGMDHEALARLRPLLTSGSLDAEDRSQALGHVGRIFKERFIACARFGDKVAAQSCLKESIDAYLTAYRENLPKFVWHGINAVALLARPEARTLDPSAGDESQRLAREVQAAVASTDPQGVLVYSAATMAEAALALNENAAALDWLRRYVRNASLNAFALGATPRQFEQVWCLAGCDSPGPELIDMLRAASFEHSDALVLMSGNDVTRALQATGRANYQAVFGSDQFQSLQNYRVGLERCASVGRIGRSADTGFGSGFLVPGKVLDNTLSERPVLVTNAHAISDVEAIRRDGALHPSEAIATFEAMDGGLATKQFNIADIVFTSPPEMLDVTVATLAQDLPLTAPIPLAAVLPVRGTPAKVRVIGHPAGRGLSFSVNDLLDHESPRVHYRTATEGGSSGSPVFNAEWKLIALHHSGGEGMKKLNQQGGTYQANEGIWIGAICEAMKLARH